MKRAVLFTVVLWAAGPAQAALSWEALPAAVAAAPAARALQEDAAAAQARPSGALRSLAPRIEAFGAGRSEGWDPGSNQSWPEAGVKGRLNLWRFGRDQARQGQLDAEAKAAEARSVVRGQDLLLQARHAWLQAWAARQRAQVVGVAQERCAKDLQRIRRQAGAGLVPRSDVLALEVLAAELDQHIFDEGHLADEAEHHLAALLGLEAAQAEGLTLGIALSWPVADAPQTAKRGEQDLLQAEIMALEQQSSALGGAWQPSLDLDSQARWGRPGYELGQARDWQAGAALSLAWDPAGALDREQAWLGGLAKARQSALQARQKADAVEREELGHALASWVGRQAAVEQRLKSTEAYRQAVLEENSRGVRDSRDLAESNQDLLEAEQDRIVAQARAWGVWAELQTFLSR